MSKNFWFPADSEVIFWESSSNWLLLSDVLNLSLKYGDDDYDNMGDDDYDDYSKELNQYKKSKDRGRGESGLQVYVFVFVFGLFLSWRNIYTVHSVALLGHSKTVIVLLKNSSTVTVFNSYIRR